MKKRRITQALTILLLLSLALGSCSRRNDYRYYFAYPEAYTAAFFHQNYVECDPNLIHLKAAEKSETRIKKRPRGKLRKGVISMYGEAYSSSSSNCSAHSIMRPTAPLNRSWPRIGAQMRAAKFPRRRRAHLEMPLASVSSDLS